MYESEALQHDQPPTDQQFAVGQSAAELLLPKAVVLPVEEVTLGRKTNTSDYIAGDQVLPRFVAE